MKTIKIFMNRNKSFFQFADQWLKKHTDNDGSYRRKISQLRSLIRFCNIDRLKDININAIELLDTVLHEKKFSGRYIESIHSTTKLAIKWLVANGYLRANPYDKAILRKVKKVKKIKFIEQDDYQAIQEAKSDKAMTELARDLFVFSCNTGLSYCDLMTISIDKIITHEGRKWLIAGRNKTGVDYYVPLNNIALDIIYKYQSTTILGRVHKPNCLFPTISLGHYNRLLKELAKDIGLSVHLSSHRARHTFATLMLERGISMESISKMMGHASTTMTELYSKVTMRKIKKELEKVA